MTTSKVRSSLVLVLFLTVVGYTQASVVPAEESTEGAKGATDASSNDDTSTTKAPALPKFPNIQETDFAGLADNQYYCPAYRNVIWSIAEIFYVYGPRSKPYIRKFCQDNVNAYWSSEDECVYKIYKLGDYVLMLFRGRQEFVDSVQWFNYLLTGCPIADLAEVLPKRCEQCKELFKRVRETFEARRGHTGPQGAAKTFICKALTFMKGPRGEEPDPTPRRNGDYGHSYEPTRGLAKECETKANSYLNYLRHKDTDGDAICDASKWCQE